MRKLRALSVLVLLAIALASCVTTAPQNPTVAPATPTSIPATVTPKPTRLNAIKQAGVIRVGTSPDFPPYEYRDKDGNRIGFDISVMEEIARRLGVKVEWVELPFNELIDNVARGNLDTAISAFARTPDRDQKVDFTIAYYIPEDAFIALDSFADTINKPEDLGKFKVGVQIDTIQDLWLKDTLVKDGKIEEGNIIRYASAQEAIDGLTNGEIQVLVGDFIPAQILTAPESGLKVVYHGVLSSGPISIVIPDNDEAMVKQFNEFIRQMAEEGFTEDLAIKVFGGQ